MNAWYTMQSSYTAGQLSEFDFALFKDDVRVLVEIYPGLLPAGVEVMSRYKGMLDLEINAQFADYAARIKKGDRE